MTDTSINAFNLKIRQTPWYQQWFAERGLNPNQVQLDNRQREELKQLVQQKAGFQFPGDMKIDPAGNLNEKGGWAGLPTGVKIAIIAGATIATAGAAGAFSGAAAPAAIGGGGASTGAAGASASMLGGYGASTIPGAVAGAAGGAAAGGSAASTGGILGTLGMGSKAAMAMKGVGIAGQLAGAAAKQRAADRGAQADYDLTAAQNNANNTQMHNAQALQYATARQQADRTRMRELMGNDALVGMKPPSDPRAARFTSGPRISNETLQMVRARTLAALEDGRDVPQLREVGPMPNMPQGTKADSFLKVLRMAGLGLEALRESGIGTRTQAAPVDDRSTVNLPQPTRRPGTEDDDWWDQYSYGRG